MAIVYRPQKTQEIFLSCPADIAIYGGAAGGGKASHISTLIPSPNGFKCLGEIEDGDVIFDERGLQCRVIKAHDAFVPDECYRIEFDDGSTIDCCSDHLWFTYTASDLEKMRRRDPDWMERRRMSRPSRAKFSQGALKSNMVIERNKKTAEQNRELLSRDPIGGVKTTREIAGTLVLRSGRKNHAIPVCGAWEMPEADLPLDPYLLGVWLGDGTTRDGSIATADCEIVDAFANAGFNVKQYAKYMWGINGLRRKLREIGVFGNKHVPEIYMRASSSQRLALLQGLFDTDGTAKPNTARAIFYSKLEHLANSAFDLAVSLGMKPTLTTKRAKFDGRDYGICHIVAVSSDLPLFRLTRKLDRIAPARSVSRFRYIVSCERIPSVPMRCLTVDSPSRLYLIGRTAIPTHNTFALLFEMARHYRNQNWGGVIFRHEAKQILNEGGLRDSAMEMYPGLGAEYRSQPMPTFTFPSGARVSFSHINLDTEVAGWQGSQIPTLGFDELCHFSSFVFFYMMSRNRSTCGVKPYIRATCNPDPDSWVADFIAWWIDQETGYPIKERGGKIRHFVRRPTGSGMEIVWGDTNDDVAKAMGFDRPKDREIEFANEQLDAALLRGEDIPDDIASGPVQYVKAVRQTRSMSFIPSSVYDNAALLSKDPGYLANLKSLDRVEQARLLGGNWKVRAAAGLYFPVQHVQIVQKLSQNVMQWLRMWDLAATEPNEAHDPDWTVGLKIGRTWTGTVVVGDVIRVRKNARFVRDLVKATAMADGRSCWIGMIQDPGQAGKPIYEDESVLVGDGSVRALKDISVGDRVIGKDGRSHEVDAVYNQGRLKTVKIETECGRVVRAAPDHPFLTTEGWVNAGDLTTNCTLALLSSADVDSSCSRTAEEFRLAGYFIGDGSVGRKSNTSDTSSCNSGFCCADDVQLQDFIHCVESIGGSVVRRKYRGIDFGAKGIQQWLRDTELNGSTSYTKRVPSWVFLGSKALVAEFIGAFFACDGTVSKDGDEVVFYSVSKELLIGVRTLLLRLGISSTLKRKNGKYLESRHVSYLLRMRQQDDGWRRFANRVPVHHSMKRHRLRELSARSRFRRFDESYIPDKIVSISDGGYLPCRCLSVRDANSFVVNDLVVHNSQFESYRDMLRGYSVFSCCSNKKKELTAEPVAAEWQGNNVVLVLGGWNSAFIDELEKFPTKGVHDDQVDALSNGYSLLPPVGQPNYAEAGGLRRRGRER